MCEHTLIHWFSHSLVIEGGLKPHPQFRHLSCYHLIYTADNADTHTHMLQSMYVRIMLSFIYSLHFLQHAPFPTHTHARKQAHTHTNTQAAPRCSDPVSPTGVIKFLSVLSFTALLLHATAILAFSLMLHTCELVYVSVCIVCVFLWFRLVNLLELESFLLIILIIIIHQQCKQD